MTRRTLLVRAAAVLFAGMIPAAFRRKAVGGPYTFIEAVQHFVIRWPRPEGFLTSRHAAECIGRVNRESLSFPAAPGTIQLLNLREIRTATVAGESTAEIECHVAFKASGWNNVFDSRTGRHRAVVDSQGRTPYVLCDLGWLPEGITRIESAWFEAVGQ